MLGAVECLEREGLSLPLRKMLVIARRAFEPALAKGTKPEDELPKLVQDARYLLAS
ncbi:hypothetical protein [Paracoccus sp. MC1862]|uniref:hypothetical protein n=1 Tax=Paracoccus sp. MC1862 TaxID=2760307 RepID=UPI0016004787|nr:hypothetical protein [Paracoccus sp. MC1862]MBB1499657.1 hypothetical protein [Paracoccus sp. MC1862]